MPTLSSLTLTTTDGKRIIKRLSNHWQHKFAINTQAEKTTILFSDTDSATLFADDNQLIITLSTNSDENHQKLQGVILSHINRMANAEFEGIWESV